MDIIEMLPARITRRGRQRPAEYLAKVDYPGLLSGERPVVTLVGNPDAALAYTDDQALQAALLLVHSMGYDAKAVSRDPVKGD